MKGTLLDLLFLCNYQVKRYRCHPCIWPILILQFLTSFHFNGVILKIVMHGVYAADKLLYKEYLLCLWFCARS
jgi:hypothetical protein